MNPMQIPFGLLPTTSGGIEAVIYDPNEQPASVITTTQPFDVECSWYFETSLPLTPDWRLQVAYQQIGGADAGVVDTAVTPTPNANGKVNALHPKRKDYLEKVSFPVGKLPMAAGDKQRAYQLIAVLSSESGGVPAGFAGYYDLGVIQVIK